MQPSLVAQSVKTKEGFVMASYIPHSPHHGSGKFQKVVDAFLAGEGLPFADILSADRIHRIFAKHGNLFGAGAIYSTDQIVSAAPQDVMPRN